MKTLEELKQEMDDARAVYEAVWDAYIDARDAYAKKLKELDDEDA